MWNAAGDSGELATALIPAVWTFLGVVVVTLGTIAVQAQKSRSERRNAPDVPPVAVNGNGTSHLMQIAKDIGQLDQRAEDNDQRDDMQDRHLDRQDQRIEALERYNDHRDPGWRQR